MSDPITLTAGMRQNLFSLQKTENLLEITQGRLATGKRVNSALDDPVAYFAALGHEQRASDLAARKDEMSEAIQTAKAAEKGIETINTLIAQAKALAQSAKSAEDDATKTSLVGDFDEILNQITYVANDSGYKGINLLGGATETIVVEFDEEGDSSLTLTGFDATSSGLLLTAGSDWTDPANIQASLDELEAATTTLRTEAKTFATNLNVITARQDFTSNMINVLRDGAAELTIADMNEEGANMLMLQTRQALGTTSLSLASQAAQSVLRLF